MKYLKNNIKMQLGLLIAGIFIAGLLWALFIRMEGQEPIANIILPGNSLGLSQNLNISITDNQSGIKRIWFGILQGGREVILKQKRFPADGFIKGGKGGGKLKTASLEILFEPKTIGITDGEAILRLAVWDYSWRNWAKGNHTYLEKKIMIDTSPPKPEVISKIHNINQGGSGLVIYRLSENCRKSGVVAGDNFFPGHSGLFKDPKIFTAFFALSYKQGPGTQLFVKAVDMAGNTGKKNFSYHINKRVFKKDIIKISDRFLNWKMPEFDTSQDQSQSDNIIDKFLKINNEIRRKNTIKIFQIALVTENKKYWQKKFLRLPKSANRAGFADARAYAYKGKIIDNQVHMGIDLASTAHSRVPAANPGKIVFINELGIYGKTIIIDHGFGLFSMYSHLSKFFVKSNQVVKRREIIGETGRTGLAGGDHLHFGMLIHNTFVNPIEWWDKKWIQNNIIIKINNAQAEIK